MKKLLVLLALFSRVHAMEHRELIPIPTEEPVIARSLSDELKEHTLEISIASLYLAGGLPFFSDTTRWACDISGSILWLTTSVYACISTLVKHKRVQKSDVT